MKTIQLVGRVGGDPETRTVGDKGTLLAKFSVAVRCYKDGNNDATEWYDVAVFGRRAEFVRDHIKKGASVYVSGEMTYRDWTTQDGDKRRSYEVKAFDVSWCPSQPKNDGATGGSTGGIPTSSAEDIPF